MPKKATHTHRAPCTQSQKEAAKQALNQAKAYPAYRIKSEADLIRLGLSMVCEAFGVDYPDDLQGRGKYDRSKIDWQKLADK